MSFPDRCAVRAVPALAALLLLCSCVAPGPPPVDTRPVGREDPYRLSPLEGYPLAAAPELADRIGGAFDALRRGDDLAGVRAIGLEVLTDDPGFHPASVLLAQVEDLEGEHDAAVERLLPIVGELPTYSTAQLSLGQAAERASDSVIAYQAYAELTESLEESSWGTPEANRRAAERAEQLYPQAVEIVLTNLQEAADRGRLEDAELDLGWLNTWAADSLEALEGTRRVAVERGDLETELAAVRRLVQEDATRDLRIREAELEAEIGDLRSGLEMLESLNREFADDLKVAELLRRAEFRWRLQLLPPEVQAIGRKVELDRADVSSLLYWLVPRVRYSQITNPPIAADILDHPRRNEILRVLNLGLMEIDETRHRFEPDSSASRIVLLRAQLALLASAPKARSCMEKDFETLQLDRSWSSLCQNAARCRLIPEAADCRPEAAISGAEALELFRQTLNLLGSGG